MRSRALVLGIILAAGTILGEPTAGGSDGFPTAGVIVFSDDGTPYTLLPDGSALTSLGELGASEPRFSPGGRRIAYVNGEHIRVARNDGTAARRLTRPPAGGSDSGPAWSPSGRSLVFTRSVPKRSTRAARSGLRVIRLDGTGGRWLDPAGSGLWAPDWSPEGRRIAAHEPVGEAGGRLWVVGADGRNRRRLGPRNLSGQEPRWSPDGRRIAFVDVEAGVVRILDLRTNRVRTVFEPEPETYDTEYVGWGHAWSPDGRWLAVQWTNAVECVDDPTSASCSRAEIWVVSATDTRQRMIHAGPLMSYGNGLDWRRR